MPLHEAGELGRWVRSRREHAVHVVDVDSDGNAVASIVRHVVDHVGTPEASDGFGSLGLALQPVVDVDDVVSDDDLWHDASSAARSMAANLLDRTRRPETAINV